MASRSFWTGRRVLVTGHTGFKGTWLCAWLADLGAEVTGIGLPPATEPALFAAAGLASRIDSRIGDIRARHRLARLVRQARPEIVFHLAAQALVIEGLADPLTTLQSNVLGTANLLDAARDAPDLRTIVVVTSDKCYRQVGRPCTEDDSLGGEDPYGASKACAEIVAEAYRHSYFARKGVGLATARAGNVIGGGDFAPGRLLPDLIRAYRAGRPAELRRPSAVRPWQHVLDALAGYLRLAERLHADPGAYAGPWNFGPLPEELWTVACVADAVAEALGRGSWRQAYGLLPPEMPILRLSSEQAERRLGWRPQLDTGEAIAWTVAGYTVLAQTGGTDWLLEQIARYEVRLAGTGYPLGRSPETVHAHA